MVIQRLWSFSLARGNYSRDLLHNVEKCNTIELYIKIKMIKFMSCIFLTTV